MSKGTDPVEGADTPLGDRTDMVYMNTNVTRGAGEFVVTATGMATRRLATSQECCRLEKGAKTPLTRQLDKLTRQIFLIAGLALAVSVVISLARGDTFTAVFNAAVAFAIGALPENLPAVVTTILAYGTQALAKVGAIMKRLQSTETLGSTAAINSDKTGTLTLNQMTAVQMAVVGRRYAIEGSGYSAEGQITHVGGQREIPLDEFLLPMVLASDAVLADGELIGDPTEGALVALAAKGGIDPVLTRQANPRVAELPFDAAYKLMATFHEMTDGSGKKVIRCFVKGAPDQLLARSAAVYDADAGPVPADGDFRELYLAENRRLGEQGLRVMATARKDFDPAAFDPAADLLPLVEDLELLALVGIVDPPRPTAKASIATARTAGIRVRMITGDHAVTAGAIADQLGIEGRVITGTEFGAMSDEEALRTIDEVGVIARVTPEHKVRLVDLLKSKGQIVAMTGDGVNDAPALKRADIGIAMGITGTEVTKEAAVMILTDDDFSTIVKAVELGRGLYDNLVKYIRFQMGALFGFIISFLGAAILNIAGGVPFLPLQTLWINFTTLLFQAIGLGYGQPATGLMKRQPRQPDRPILGRGLMAWLITIGLIMGTGTLGVISWAEQTRTRDRRAHHGRGDLLAVLPVLLHCHQRRARDGVLAGHLLRQDLRPDDRRLSTAADPVDRARAAGGAAEYHQPRRPAMAYLHLRRIVGHCCLRDPQGGATAGWRPDRARWPDRALASRRRCPLTGRTEAVHPDGGRCQGTARATMAAWRGGSGQPTRLR